MHYIGMDYIGVHCIGLYRCALYRYAEYNCAFAFMCQHTINSHRLCCMLATN